METKRQNLCEALASIFASEEVSAALSELTYTAYETGLIAFKFHDDEDLKTMMKLVYLAERYRVGVPDRLRM